MRLHCVALALLACGACSDTPTEPTRPPTPLTVSLSSGAWETISDPQPYPLSNDGSELIFDFPSSGSIHYLFTASALKEIRGTLSISFRISTSGPVIFNSLDPQSASCSIASSLRPFIWSNDNGNGSYDRWWSNPRSVVLAPGSGTLDVPLTPAGWSSVNGRFADADAGTKFEFARALLNVTRLGLTFGGGCSFGHGINIQGGTAKFALTQYVIK